MGRIALYVLIQNVSVELFLLLTHQLVCSGSSAELFFLHTLAFSSVWFVHFANYNLFLLILTSGVWFYFTAALWRLFVASLLWGLSSQLSQRCLTQSAFFSRLVFHVSLFPCQFWFIFHFVCLLEMPTVCANSSACLPSPSQWISFRL